MKYICEDCSKIFDTEKNALDCEKKHKEEKIRQAKLAEQKQARTDTIKADFEKLLADIKEFEKDYGNFKFNSEDRKIFNSLPLDFYFWI